MKKSRLLITITCIALLAILALTMSSCGNKDKSTATPDINGMIAQLEEKLSTLESKTNAEITTLKSEYDVKVAELERKNAEHTEEIATLTAEHDAKIAELEAKDKANADALAALKAEYAKDLATLEKADADNTAAIVNLNTAYTDKVAELEAKDKANTDALAALEAEYVKDLAALEKADADNTAAIANLNKTYNDKVAELVATDRANADALAALETEYAKDLAALQMADEENREALNSLTSTYNAQVKVLEEADKANADKLAELEKKYEASVADLNSKIASNESKISQLHRDLQTNIDVLVAKHDTDFADINSLITALQSADTSNKERLSYLETKVAELLNTPKYTVSFNTNGGVESYAQQTIEEGKKAAKPANPTRDGYVFLGWYLNDELWSFSGHVVTDDITLTAKWDTVVHYTLSYDNTYYTVDGLNDKTATEVEIFSEFNSLPVISILPEAFKNCTSIKKVLVPVSITTIGADAFAGCYSIEEMVLPFAGASADATTASETTLFGYIFGKTIYDGSNALTQNYSDSASVTYYIPKNLRAVTINGSRINDYTFYGCSQLTNITFGNEITHIGKFALSNCSGLKNITIPAGVTRLNSYVFSNCTGIKNIIIPDSVTEIASHALYGCTSLEEITIPFVGGSKDAMHYSGVFGWIFGYTTTQQRNSVDYTGRYSIEFNTSVIGSVSNTTCQYTCRNARYTGDLGDGYLLQSYWYYIPSSIKQVTVTGGDITVAAFYKCSNLETIVLGSNITKIDNYAFSNCTSLNSVYYEGTSDMWSTITIGSYNSPLTSAARYYYSEAQPTESGNYWYYDKNKNIVVWQETQ